jgi:hypothetical protein
MWPERIAGAGVDHQQAIVAGAFARRADDRLVWASSALSASSPDPDVHCNRLSLASCPLSSRPHDTLGAGNVGLSGVFSVLMVRPPFPGPALPTRSPGDRRAPPRQCGCIPRASCRARPFRAARALSDVRLAWGALRRRWRSTFETAIDALRRLDL